MNEPITKVICKKYFSRGGGDRVKFYPEVEYKFSLETEENSFISKGIYDVPYKYKFIFIYYDDDKSGYRFHLNKYDTAPYFVNFYDYFYDIKELRKLKILKLNEKN